MAILVDPPRWPAHGTHFGHLVSDFSLEELHDFAQAAGLPARAFDHDHYDVPARRYPDLLALGAVEVPSTTLLRRLVAGGLRVRPADRTPSRAVARSAAIAGWPLPRRPDVRDELLRRWSEPHRRYHDVRHLANCLAALEALTDGSPPLLVTLAVWCHDAVHTGEAGADEQASADLAAELLGDALPAAEVAEVVRLVLETVVHDPAPGDEAAELLVDADLSVLGQLRGRYHVYRRDVREEYARFTDEEFRKGRLAVVEALLNRDPLYRTTAARARWEATARVNLAEERAALLRH